MYSVSGLKSRPAEGAASGIREPELDLRSVGVVLPALNEADCLEALLEALHGVLLDVGLRHEIIVVDDGSTDDTARIASAASRRLPVRLIRHDGNQGYGRALRTGMRAAAADHDVVLTMDADASHEPRTIGAMITRIKYGADVVVASRYCAGGVVVGVPLHRRMLSRIVSVLVSGIVPTRGLRDVSSGFRAYRAESLRRVWREEPDIPTEPGFVAGFELLLALRDVGARFVEVPLLLRYDQKQSVSQMTITRTSRSYLRILARRVGPREPRTVASGSTARRAGQPSGEAFLRWTTLLADVVAVLTGVTVGYPAVRALSDAAGLPPMSGADAAVLAVGYATVVVVAMSARRSYRKRPEWLGLQALRDAWGGLGVAAAVFLSIIFLGDAGLGSPAAVLALVVVASGFVLGARRFLWSHFWTRRVLEPRGRRILVCGASEVGLLLLKKIMQGRTPGAKVVGFADDALPTGSRVRLLSGVLDTRVLDVSVLGGLDDIWGIIRAHDIDQVLVAAELPPAQEVDLLERCRSLNVDVGFVPRIGNLRPDEIDLEDIAAISVLRPRSTEAGLLYLGLKRVFDIAVSLILLPLAVPVTLIAALLVKLDSPGPALVAQTRIGRDGAPFRVLKLRTMRDGVNPYAPSPTSLDDARITGVGRLLRGAGIDELPQLLNVLEGEMSLVGPRPEMPFIVASYTEQECQRLRARPGITGLWQLSADRQDEIHHNLEHDILYLRDRDFVLDLMILAETAIFVLCSTGRTVAEALRRASTGDDTREARAAAKDTGSSEESILVVLDQRCRPMEPPSWNRFLPIVGAIARDWPIGLIVADRNGERFGELLAQRTEEAPEARQSPSLLQYDSAAIDEAMSHVDLVITDLPHIAERAMARGLDLMSVNGSRQQLSTAPRDSANGEVDSLYGPLVQRLERYGMGVSVSERPA